MKKTLAIAVALLSCACIKPPDDGMALGEETTVDAVNQAYVEALGNIPEEQAFHVNDRGVYQSMETIFSSTRAKEIDVFTITKMDSQYITYSIENVSSGAKKEFQRARSQQASPTPAPTPAPVGTPKPTSEISQISNRFEKFVNIIKSKMNQVLAKITIQVSTAVGETEFPSSKSRILDDADLKIMASLGEEGPATLQQFFGLKTYKHVLKTNNTSQIKEGKVNATHIEFNEIDTKAGVSQKYHWVYEISNEVPGLFVKLSECASSVAIVNNGQVPYMECNILDTFSFGGN